MKEIYMKNKFFLVLAIMIFLTVVVAYYVYNYRVNMVETQKINKEYQSYSNVQMLGTELISIINKTTDINNNHNIPKDENNYYLDNGENSIKIYINFIYKDKTKTLQMEDINKGRYRRIYKKI